MAHSSNDQVSGAAGDDEITSLLKGLNLDSATVADLLGPCSTVQAAEILGMSPGTLKNLRVRCEGPPGWVIIPGVGGRYRSKLDVLNWFRQQHRLASSEPSQRGAA